MTLNYMQVTPTIPILVCILFLFEDDPVFIVVLHCMWNFFVALQLLHLVLFVRTFSGLWNRVDKLVTTFNPF